MKIGMFTGSTYGNTRAAADRLELIFKQVEISVDHFDIAFVPITKLLEYDVLLIGCSTWYVGEIQDDWHSKFDQLATLELTGKRVAFFGMGDQFTYSASFQDALGDLATRCEQRGARLIGSTSTDGYSFSASRAARDGRFVGLALDDDNQAKLTEPRLQAWARQLIRELSLESVPQLQEAQLQEAI